MYIDRFFPLKTSAYEDMDEIKRCNSGSLSESDDCRKTLAADNRKDIDFKKKRRRGRKRNRPKWKPYAKMSEEERKAWQSYDESRMAQKEKKLAVMSMRPVAPFNTTQFLMEDRSDSSQVYKPHPSEINRCVSFDSSTSGWVANHSTIVNPNISLSPPTSQNLFSFSFSPSSLIFLGEESFELEDNSFHEQEAFLEADFNQVYTQMKLDRLEVMSKQDLVQQCYTLEDRIDTIQQEREQERVQAVQLLKDLQELQEVNRKLSEDNSKLCSPSISIHN